MSCYVCDAKTISCIAKAFFEYGVVYADDNGYRSRDEILVVSSEVIQKIGQSLLDCNLKSVNTRYGENNTQEFKYEEVEIDEGTVWGCIDCYMYQSCEFDGWLESKVYASLMRLQGRITERMFRKLDMKVPWGYGGHDCLSE